jgi:hypothetical protein
VCACERPGAELGAPRFVACDFATVAAIGKGGGIRGVLATGARDKRTAAECSSLWGSIAAEEGSQEVQVGCDLSQTIFSLFCYSERWDGAVWQRDQISPSMEPYAKYVRTGSGRG